MITFISVPRKGRNAGWALKDVLGTDNYFDPDYIADFLNGRAKKESKKESWGHELSQEFNQKGWQEITRKADTGRKSQRAVLDEIKVPETGSDIVVSGGLPERELFSSSGPYEIYVADDQAGNRLLREKDLEYCPRDQDLKSFLTENVSSYRPVDEVGETVSLSVMWPENRNPQDFGTVVLPEDLYNLSEQIADSYWDQDMDKISYREFAESENFSNNWDEEQLISETGKDVTGVYITNSGGTAREYGLDYDEVVDSTVRRWSRTQNNVRGDSI